MNACVEVLCLSSQLKLSFVVLGAIDVQLWLPAAYSEEQKTTFAIVVEQTLRFRQHSSDK